MFSQPFTTESPIAVKLRGARHVLFRAEDGELGA